MNYSNIKLDLKNLNNLNKNSINEKNSIIKRSNKPQIVDKINPIKIFPNKFNVNYRASRKESSNIKLLHLKNLSSLEQSKQIEKYLDIMKKKKLEDNKQKNLSFKKKDIKKCIIFLYFKT